jgi:hypothetical protein
MTAAELREENLAGEELGEREAASGDAGVCFRLFAGLGFSI